MQPWLALCFLIVAEAQTILRDSVTFAIQTFLFQLIVVLLKGSAAQMAGLRAVLSLENWSGKSKYAVILMKNSFHNSQ